MAKRKSREGVRRVNGKKYYREGNVMSKSEAKRRQKAAEKKGYLAFIGDTTRKGRKMYFLYVHKPMAHGTKSKRQRIKDRERLYKERTRKLTETDKDELYHTMNRYDNDLEIIGESIADNKGGKVTTDKLLSTAHYWNIPKDDLKKTLVEMEAKELVVKKPEDDPDAIEAEFALTRKGRDAYAYDPEDFK